MVVTSATVLQRDLIKIPMNKTTVIQNLSLRFLVQLIAIACIYQLYSAGFVYLAGIYSTTSAILIVGTIIRFFFNAGDKK